jgi:hypothetical protein
LKWVAMKVKDDDKDGDFGQVGGCEELERDEK